MIDKGVKRRKALLINALSALAATASAAIFFMLGSDSDISLAPLMAVVAGFFIYIATTDIIPTIHAAESRKEIWQKMAWLLIGVVSVSLIIGQLHSIIDVHTEQEHSEIISESDHTI
jgi:zinc and cadmium transporter